MIPPSVPRACTFSPNTGPTLGPPPPPPAACSSGRLLQGVGVEGSGRLTGSHARAQPRFLDDKGCSFPGLHTGFQWGPADHTAGAVCDKGEAEGSSAGVGEP